MHKNITAEDNICCNKYNLRLLKKSQILDTNLHFALQNYDHLVSKYH